jgi:hypothetical protein
MQAQAFEKYCAAKAASETGPSTKVAFYAKRNGEWIVSIGIYNLAVHKRFPGTKKGEMDCERYVSNYNRELADTLQEVQQ